MRVIKIGQGKYCQIFAPCNILSSDKPPDLTNWPSMLVRTDKNGVRRPTDVVIRLPRLNNDDRATDDGSIANAHEEATNLCEAAIGGFGPTLMAAFFIPDPDPPRLDSPPRHAFRFVSVIKRQSASLDQRSRVLDVSLYPSLSQGLMSRYFTMLLDTVFEYSAREIVFLDSTRGNFMDEETARRANANPKDLSAVDRVNVIDLDPRFYLRLHGAPRESVWLFNTVLVLAHIRRVDTKCTLIARMMQMTLHGGMTLADLICKVYREQQHNPSSSWLFSVPWNELPPRWKPHLESDWKNAIGSQLQEIAGYYFFYAERDGCGHNALQVYERACYGRDPNAVEKARAHFNEIYIKGGSMQTARHFLLATKDTSVTSLIYALMMYVDSAALCKRPKLTLDATYVKPTPLPRMHEPFVSADAHLGLLLKSEITVR